MLLKNYTREIDKEVNKKEDRIAGYDIAKAIGLFFVILGHMPTLLPSWFISWIGGFHMPLFIFISGCFARKPVDTSDFLNRIKKKIIHILIPYFIYSLLFSFIEAIVRHDSNYLKQCLIDTLLGHGGYYMLWFLFALFIIEILFMVLTFFVKDKKIQIMVVSLCVILGYIISFFSWASMFMISTILYSFGFYYIAYLYYKGGEIKRVFWY